MLTLLGVARCTFIMGIPGAADVMLGNQCTSFHHALYLRQVLGVRHGGRADGAPRKKRYAAAAVLNLVGATTTLLDKDLMKGDEYVVLALIQGVPMLLKLPLRRRQEAAAPTGA